jgi:hypothetical protein
MTTTSTDILPHRYFTDTRPDEVAECWEGAADVPGLYESLWRSMETMKPISEQIDMEESSPLDAIGLNNVASVWSAFSDAEKVQLNELAARQEAYIKSLFA